MYDRELIVITIKLDYSKVPSKSTVPTYVYLLSESCFMLQKVAFKPDTVTH